MEILKAYSILVDTMQKYDIYQEGDEVDLALVDLKSCIDDSTDVKLITELGKYLCGNDDELLVMWKAIKGAINQNCVIDYIDEVQTTEQFEFCFTCSEFIELIEP